MTTKYFIERERNETNHLNFYYYTNAFSNEEVQNILVLGESQNKQNAVTGTNSKPNDYRVSEIAWIDGTSNSKWLYDKVASLAYDANKTMWNFDVWGYHDDFQYTKYYGGDQGHYDWHMDLGPNMSNRKLSCVIQLSDPSDYEGGELEFNLGYTILSVPKGKGVITFFPSFLLHRVTPVTKGTRISLVTWLCGANLR